MPQPHRSRSDRAAMVAVAVVLVVAAVVVLLASRGTDFAAVGQRVAVASVIAAVALSAWAALRGRADAARRGALDRAVDDEMGRKWQPGFAATVGAFDKPWYVLCGEPGVGKTAALRAGRLPMALGPDGQPVTDAEQGRQGTYLFDWWFFQDAVVLDSAGDLITHADDRWGAFLDRVRAARPDRPVNGMLLAVSAADLIAGDADSLKAKATLLARQVRAARQRLRVRFPLYLLVTKADLIPGFADFFPTGSDLRASFQILGWSDARDPRRNDAPVTPADVRRGLDGLLADLRRRRAATEATATAARPDAQRRLDHLDELFAFPAAAAAALDNLGPFLAALLEQVGSVDDAVGPPTPPFFRGVYLTSALRTGEALDAELAKAFGTDLRPTARRAASDRAFFIRDLLLEKVVPEAGMVAPLVAVPAAAGRRSRALAAAAVVAAVLVGGGSAVGYHRTVSRAKADRDFWNALAAVPPNQLAARVALFDPAGQYRGDAPFDGDTVLAAHERSAALARADTVSPLLPASAVVNRDRLAAHADLFRRLALIPALVPGPFAPVPSPDRAAAAVLRVLADTRPNDRPVSTTTLRADAADLLPLRTGGADDPRVAAVLVGGDAGEAVSLTDAQRQRIADGVVAWVDGDLTARRSAAADAVAHARAVARDVVAVAGLLDAFQGAIGQAAVPEDLVDPVRAFDRAVAAHPAADDAAAVDRRTLTAALRPPPELATVSAAVAKLGDGDADVRRRLAAAVLGFNESLDAQRAAASAVPGLAVARSQLRPVDGRGTPLIAARRAWFRSAAASARDAVATATSRPADPATPAAVALPAALARQGADDAARRHTFDALADADDPADRDADVAAADHLFDLARRAATTAVWTDVRPPDVRPLWPTATPAATDTLVAWLAAQRATETALRTTPPARGADDARRWVAASHEQLGRLAKAWLADWQADAARAVGPPVATWADVGRLAGADPASAWVAAFVKRIGGDRAGVDVVARQDLFPDLRAVAEAWGRDTDRAVSPEATARYEAVRSFLHGDGFGRDAVNVVRDRVVSDPAALASLGHLAGGGPTPVEAYWAEALARSVGLLSDTARQHTRAVLRDVRAAVANRYPLDPNGSAAWDGVVDARLAAGLALATVGGEAIVLQIQGLDVVTPAWQRYLADVRGVVTFAQHPPTAWTVTALPAAPATDDAWAAVAISATADTDPPRWHPFDQHRATAVTWPGVIGGLTVRLSRDGDHPDRTAVSAAADLARPWAAYRLAVTGGAVADDVNRVVVRLDRHGDPAVAVVPVAVPMEP